MKTSFYFVFLSMITFSFCSCYAQKQESNSPPLRTDEFIVGDTIYLDTLIIDNKIDRFDSKEYHFKTNVDQALFIQKVHNVTNDTLRFVVRGNPLCTFVNKMSPNSYAELTYLWNLEYKSGTLLTETTMYYKIANSKNDFFSKDDIIKHFALTLHGRKE